MNHPDFPIQIACQVLLEFFSVFLVKLKSNFISINMVKSRLIRFSIQQSINNFGCIPRTSFIWIRNSIELFKSQSKITYFFIPSYQGIKKIWKLSNLNYTHDVQVWKNKKKMKKKKGGHLSGGRRQSHKNTSGILVKSCIKNELSANQMVRKTNYCVGRGCGGLRTLSAVGNEKEASTAYLPQNTTP